MSSDAELGLPRGTRGEQELFLRWLRSPHGAVIRKVEGLSDEQARWTSGGALICLVGIVNHLAHVEWRWIDGGMLGQETSRSDAEFARGADDHVALPVPGHSPVGDLGRPFADHHPVFDPFSAGIGPAQGAAALDVERLVDRFVTDAHPLIVGDVDRDAPGDLFPQRRMLDQFGPAGPPIGLGLREGRPVPRGLATAGVAPELPVDRGRGAAPPLGDLLQLTRP